MPRYDYKCSKCESVFELTQSFHSEPVADCPKCGDEARRLISRVAVHFKGGGWYSTDNRSNGAASRASSANGADQSTSDTKPGDTAPKSALDSSNSAEPKVSTPAKSTPATSSS